jgi:hypothetical protein
MEGFTAAELDDLFMALVLHAKSTREEQTAWVKGSRRDMAQTRFSHHNSRRLQRHLPHAPF